MSDKYPHLEDTKYPDLQNTNVWAYQNNFDFAQFQDTQMHIKLISVPWDLGEVHVGLKIVPMGNVVGWESKEERDTWLDAQQGIEWDTEYRSYHDDSMIKLPVPYEYMAYYNYIVIDYEKPPVAHTDGTGITRFLYFVRDMKQLSLNSTQCTLQLDSWSMFINDIDIAYMMMERGHYAMSKAARAEDYLKNPCISTDYLLTPDVSYGTPAISTELGCINFEDEEVYYVIACTSNPSSDDWGTKANDDWRIPSVARTRTEQDSPSYFIFAIDPDDLSSFWTNVRTDFPQFACTVKAAYLISKSLCEVQTTFTFAGTSCHTLRALNKRVDFGTLAKSFFDYGQYCEITKLYTSPYCYLEFTDGNGNNVKINVEDMGSDTPGAYRYLSIAYPYMSITAYLAGVGNNFGEKSIKYQKLGQRNFSYNGRFWDGYWQLDIPTYAIVENAKDNNLYTNWYNYLSNEKQLEKQLATELTIAQSKMDINRDTAYDSEGLARYTTKTNNAMNSDLVNNSDSVTVNNCEHYEIDLSQGSWGTPVLVTGSYTFSGKGANALVEASSENTTYLNCIQVGNSNFLTKYTQIAEGEARDKTTSISNVAGITTTQNNATATVTATSNTANSNVAGTAMGAGISAVAGDLSGVGNIITSAFTGQTSVINAQTTAQIANTNAQISASAATASATVVTNLEKDVAEQTVNKNIDNLVKASKYTAKAAAIQKVHNSFVLTKQNANATTITNANAESTDHQYQMSKALTLGGDYTRFVKAGTINNDGDCTTTTGSIDKDKSIYYADKDMRNTVLSNQIKYSKLAAGMRQPIERGYFTGGDFQSVKPNALWCNVVTQPKDAIAQAGNEFLRYGYMWNGQAQFETFNVMPKFSYWKVSDIWLTAKNLPDAWVDVVRNILLHGITVWRKPEYINNTSIFDN